MPTCFDLEEDENESTVARMSFSIHVHEVSICREERHLTFRIATIGTMCVSLNELSDGEAIGRFSRESAEYGSSGMPGHSPEREGAEATTFSLWPPCRDFNNSTSKMYTKKYAGNLYPALVLWLFCFDRRVRSAGFSGAIAFRYPVLEYLWLHWKQHELPNFCPQKLSTIASVGLPSKAHSHKGLSRIGETSPLSVRTSEQSEELCHAPVARTTRRMASRLRSTSSSVVTQEDTLIRIAVFPCQTVPLHQQVPSSCTRRMISWVFTASPNDTST